MKNIIIFLLAIGLSACSIFQSSANEEEKQTEKVEKPDEVYVFDDVSEKKDKTEEIKQLEKELDQTNVQKNESEENISVFNKNAQVVGGNYFLQLGAFSTLKRAEQYVGDISSQVPFQLSIIFNQNNSLYTVRSQAYNTREEVEIIREQFWAKNKFKDAFIITE
jgi:cell division protein FtsN